MSEYRPKEDGMGAGTQRKSHGHTPLIKTGDKDPVTSKKNPKSNPKKPKQVP